MRLLPLNRCLTVESRGVPDNAPAPSLCVAHWDVPALRHTYLEGRQTLDVAWVPSPRDKRG